MCSPFFDAPSQKHLFKFKSLKSLCFMIIDIFQVPFDPCVCPRAHCFHDAFRAGPRRQEVCVFISLTTKYRYTQMCRHEWSVKKCCQGSVKFCGHFGALSKRLSIAQFLFLYQAGIWSHNTVLFLVFLSNCHSQ